jgi:hypothetical protein
MIDKLVAALALALMFGFVGILLWYLPRPDLIGIIGATMALAAYDFYDAVIRGRAKR